MAKRQGRLFRKYAVFFVIFVGAILLVNNAFQLYFVYRDSRNAAASFQQEKAKAAAFKIERFVKGIEEQVRWTTQTPWAYDQRRAEYAKLLRNAAVIREVSQLDFKAQEQIRAFRPSPGEIETRADYSKEPKAEEIAKRPARGAPTILTHFGEVFMREDGEPYMTLAMVSSELLDGVTVAEVSLKPVWEVIFQASVGQAGYVYVTDAKGGLIAHPDTSLVQKKTSLSALHHVKAARTIALEKKLEDRTVISKDQTGRRVLASPVSIPLLGWWVFAEQPLEEAFAPVRAALLWTLALLVASLGVSVAGGLLLSRRMVRPIEAVRVGAANIGGGNLDHRLAIGTNDEVQDLAEEFNRMADELQQAYASLEQKVVERTRELSEALERQTATSDVLRVISSSPTDLQPVFDTIVRNAVRLCDAAFGGLCRFDGELITLEAHTDVPLEELEFLRQRVFPLRPARDSSTGRAVLDRAPVHIHDIRTDPEYRTPTQALARYRTTLAVPMLREGVPIGVISLWRTEVQPFSKRQIETVKTFADQAVIAVENIRLFQELQVRTRDLEQLYGLSTSIQEAMSLQDRLNLILRATHEVLGLDRAIIWLPTPDDAFFQPAAFIGWNLDETERAIRIPIDGAVPALTKPYREQTELLFDGVSTIPEEFRIREPYVSSAFLRSRNFVALPLVSRGRSVGVFVADNRESQRPLTPSLEILRTFAANAAIAIENARLFGEVEEKNSQLETANRHKSEFLANMSHELRTPLNAVIGFSEVLLEKMFGELNEKQEEYLHDILTSARHLLSLINDILDLSKIEAGRMELFLSTFDLPGLLENALVMIRERATRHGIALALEVDERVGDLTADEKKVKQIVFNLLSNAVKFTPDGGRVTVKAALAEPEVVEIAVTDTGIGIAPEDQAQLFEEFRQVGTDYARKREGTGLGLALCKKFVELHGGRIRIQSALGEGSTFAFSLPLKPVAEQEGS
jgi:signal transduction histidine kinase